MRLIIFKSTIVLILFGILAGCSSESATPQPASPAPEATAPTVTTPPSNPRGNIEKTFGQEAGIFGDTPDQVVMRFTVNAPQPIDKCDSTLAKPEIGKFVEVPIKVETFADPMSILNTTPIGVDSNWEFVSRDGVSTNVLTATARSCRFEVPEFRPNRKYDNVSVTLDLPVDTAGGFLILNFPSGGGGWEWKL